MKELDKVQDLQRKTKLAMAMKTEGAQAIADNLARSLADWLHKLVVTAGSKDEDLIQLLYEVRGAAKMLGDLGFDVRSVIDLAARHAVKTQLNLTQPPTIRRDDERSTEGQAEDGQ